MLNINAAKASLQKAIPGGDIKVGVLYQDLYLFQVFTKNPFEEDLDPFYSVNRQTGDVREFSILTDGDISEITALFVAAQK